MRQTRDERQSNNNEGSRARHERQRAVLAAVVALVGAGCGVIGVVVGSKLDATSARQQVMLEAANTRQQADLLDVRRVLDDTAVHLATAQRALDVLRDRCLTAVEEEVAEPGQPLDSAADAYKAWRRDAAKSRPALEALRLDRERLRIRLVSLAIPQLFQRLEASMLSTRTPCVAGRLKRNAPRVMSKRLANVRRLTTQYFAAVAESAGTRLQLAP